MIPRLTSVGVAITPRVLIAAFVYFSIAVINIDQTNVGLEGVYPVYTIQYITERRESRNSS